MCDERSDEQLDDELRRVTVPGSLFARLKQVTHPTDDQLDTALGSLPIPSGLSDRLKSAVADALLDESLQDVEVPAGLLARLRIIPQRRTRSAFRRLALAASLLLVLTGVYFGSLSGLLASLRPAARAVTSLHVIDTGPAQLMARPADTVRISADQPANLFDMPTVPVVWRGGPLRVNLVRLDETSTPGPAGQLIRDVERGLDLGRDVLLMRWGAYASPQQASERLPELEQVRRALNRGMDLPLVAGYDRSFLLRASTHPPVFPAAHEMLQTIRVPLSTSTASLRYTEQLVDQGRLPNPQEIRAEDFLASLDDDLPLPTGEDVSVRWAAGPAVFGSQEHSLLQLSVKAARRTGDRATHLALVVDVSQSMRRQRRIESVRKALQTLFANLDSGDSISLIAVNHEIVRQLDFAAADQQQELALWLGTLHAGGGDRLVEGVKSAFSLAIDAPRAANVSRQLAVITDGDARLANDEREQFSELLALADEGGVRTTLLQLGDDTASATERYAEGDTGFAAVTASELPWTLVELVTGVDPVVARQVQIEVHFNPQAVRAYRLVGHGPAASTGLGGEVWASDLDSAQQAALLFEVWLHDSYEDEVVSATAHWLAPDLNQPRQSTRRALTRYDIATTRGESPASLQAAAIAAEIAERLRHTGDFELRGDLRFRERRKPGGWQDIMEAAADVAPEVAARQPFQRLIELVRKLESQRRGQRLPAAL